MNINVTQIGVIGLGYVGLPLAIALAKKFNTVGFDINEKRIESINKGIDKTGEVDSICLKDSKLKVTKQLEDLKRVNFFIVTVPTPINKNNYPDLSALEKASEMIGMVIKPQSIVVYESTVYPGITEEICGDIIAKTSGLKQGIDFKLGYSPERINPGDKKNTLEKIVKVVSGEDEETLEIISQVYGSIIEAGVYKATSIKVAEAAKVIENVQRDLNIALMNELALIFERLNIRTKDVLDAAGTKWNFLSFKPGLVGGHCIGVDPYYLTAKAEALGYHPDVILAGRKINDGMGQFVSQCLIKLLTKIDKPLKQTRIAILGLTFKENVKDLRNTRIPDIVREIKDFNINAIIHDPVADPDEAMSEYGLELTPWEELKNLDAIVFAVTHKFYLDMPLEQLISGFDSQGIFMDIKSVINYHNLPNNIIYWSL